MSTITTKDGVEIYHGLVPGEGARPGETTLEGWGRGAAQPATARR